MCHIQMTDCVAEYSNTVYAMRRAFATLLPKNYDRATAKSFMGHKPGSYLLESLYDKSGMDLNLAEGILGPDEQAATVITPASLKRSVFTIRSTLTVPTDPQIRLLRPR